MESCGLKQPPMCESILATALHCMNLYFAPFFPDIFCFVNYLMLSENGLLQ